jgi:DNA-binding LacI/PurR family transcriptional regulator
MRAARRTDGSHGAGGAALAPRQSQTASVAEALAAEIARGTVPTGDMLPPERELTARFHVARVTVRRALGQLVRDGLVRCSPGVGYVVTSLRPRRVDTRPVGLVYANLYRGGPGASRSVAALEARAALADRALLVGASGLAGAGEDACIRRFLAAGVGALVVVPAQHGEASHELEAWIGKGLPVVLEGHPGAWLLPARVSGRCDRVDVDNRGGIRAVMEHLLRLGHRDFAFVSVDPADYSERCAAFREFLAEHGLTARAEWVLTGLESEGRTLNDCGRAAFRTLAAGRRLPTAVVCSHDNIALGVIAAARAAGLACPADLSVTGFNNESAEGTSEITGLTTVDSSRTELADAVMRLLEAQASGVRRKPEVVRLQAQLVVGRTCAVPRTGPARRLRRGEAA